MLNTEEDIDKNNTIHQLPVCKKEYQKMEKKIDKLEDLLNTIARELQITSHVTMENSKNMKAFLGSMDDSKKRLYDRLDTYRLDIQANSIEIKHLEEEVDRLRALLWKVTGAVVSGLISIVIYLTIKT